MNIDLMKQEKNGYTNYKFVINRKPVIPDNEVWWFMFEKLFVKQKDPAKGILYESYLVLLKPSIDKDKYGEPIWVNITSATYKYLTEYIKPTQGDVIGFKVKTVQLNGFDKKVISIVKVNDTNKRDVVPKKTNIEKVEVSDEDIDSLI